MLALAFVNLGWRAAMRAVFTGHEYGWREGLRAVFRIPLANIILIVSGRRAFMAYLRSLAGAPVTWDKTTHVLHAARLAATARGQAPVAVLPAGSPARSAA